MEKKSDQQVLDEMAKANLDIRVSTELVGCKSVIQGSLITMGVEEAIGQKIRKQMVLGNPEYYVALYIINKKQFDELKG